ncbi:hypothetical protein GQ600_27470 [Phytophthora cactorum]|nr:hypothetical protein GQ600_27470 [Phytophthora cactorum]
MEHGSDEFVFSHTFLLICWNLMCRAGNTASIHSGHISWEEDSLDIRFGHAKNDQDGTRPPIYVAVFGLGNSKLFPWGNQYDRFAKILRRLMEEPNMTNLLLTEGLKPSDIEGSATCVSSCSNGGPSAAAICIRAGWTLPGVQDTYIRYEAAGDRIVGRYVAGLPFEETVLQFCPHSSRILMMRFKMQFIGVFLTFLPDCCVLEVFYLPR